MSAGYAAPAHALSSTAASSATTRVVSLQLPAHRRSPRRTDGGTGAAVVPRRADRQPPRLHRSTTLRRRSRTPRSPTPAVSRCSRPVRPDGTDPATIAPSPVEDAAGTPGRQHHAITWREVTHAMAANAVPAHVLTNAVRQEPAGEHQRQHGHARRSDIGGLHRGEACGGVPGRGEAVGRVRQSVEVHRPGCRARRRRRRPRPRPEREPRPRDQQVGGDEQAHDRHRGHRGEQDRGPAARVSGSRRTGRR